MSKAFKSLRGLPFRPAVSALSADHKQRLQAWLNAQPSQVNRRRARGNVLDIARRHAQRTTTTFHEGLEQVLYQLEMEAAQQGSIKSEPAVTA